MLVKGVCDEALDIQSSTYAAAVGSRYSYHA